MKSYYKITVNLTDKTKRTFENVEQFEVMSQGTLYIKTPSTVTKELGAHKETKRLKETTNGLWIPFHQIKDFEVTGVHETTDKVEIAKYETKEGGKNETGAN